MRQAIAALTLALAVAGCGLAAQPSGNRVVLLTGDPVGPGAGCFTSHATGALRFSATDGITIADEDGGGTTPVMWRPGFSGRWTGSEVEILDPAGTVVATTGRRYLVAGGYVGGDSAQLTTRVFWACGAVIPT